MCHGVSGVSRGFLGGSRWCLGGFSVVPRGVSGASGVCCDLLCSARGSATRRRRPRGRIPEWAVSLPRVWPPWARSTSAVRPLGSRVRFAARRPQPTSPQWRAHTQGAAVLTSGPIPADRTCSLVGAVRRVTPWGLVAVGGAQCGRDGGSIWGWPPPDRDTLTSTLAPKLLQRVLRLSRRVASRWHQQPSARPSSVAHARAEQSACKRAPPCVRSLDSAPHGLVRAAGRGAGGVVPGAGARAGRRGEGWAAGHHEARPTWRGRGRRRGPAGLV